MSFSKSGIITGLNLVNRAYKNSYLGIHVPGFDYADMA